MYSVCLYIASPHIKFRLPRWFSLSVTCTYMPPLYYVLLDVVCCFSRKELFAHDVVRRVAELHLSTKFHVCQCCG